MPLKNLLTAIACALFCLSAAARVQATNEKLDAFFESAFQRVAARSPMFEAQLNIKTQYDRWDDLSEDYVLLTRALLQGLLGELDAVVKDAGELDEDDRLNVELFRLDLNNRIEEIDWRNDTYPVNQMFGWQSRVPAFLINYHTVASVRDADAYIARLEGVDDLFTELVAGLERREAAGVVPPKFVLEHVLSDARNVISGVPFDDSEGESAIHMDFARKVDALEIDDAAKAALMQRAEEALRGPVRAGYEKLISFVEGQLTRATTDDGIWKVPDGEAYYAYRLHAITTTDLTADEIHELGIREVTRIHDEMRVIVEQVMFDGTLGEFFDHMREASEFYLPDTEDGRSEYLMRAGEIIDGMRARLDELFITTPRADIIVKRVEPFREKTAGKAFYQSPSPDGTRPGTYFVNLYNMRDMPTYQMDALAFHEGIPGHHMQRAISIEMKDLPRFRKYMSNTAYTEGWGLYSELVPKEIGFYQDPYADFGRLSMELWRACRLVVDTGIHHKHWTRERAIEYLDENTPNPHGDVVRAIDRYIVMPGQATAYKIGMIKILELREAAREQLGDRFDIREFHDVVLRSGPVPLFVLERRVNDWVAGVLANS